MKYTLIWIKNCSDLFLLTKKKNNKQTIILFILILLLVKQVDTM